MIKKISISDKGFSIDYYLFVDSGSKVVTDAKEFEEPAHRDNNLRGLLADMLIFNFEQHLDFIGEMVKGYHSSEELLKRCRDGLKYMAEHNIEADKKNTVLELSFYCGVVLLLEKALKKILDNAVGNGNRQICLQRNEMIMKFCKEKTKKL